MEIQWLREYVQLSKTLNYRKAAELLFVTPSTLSKHVIMIEKELGVLLLIRDTKSVELTHAGRMFADSASAIVREYDSVRSQIGGSHTIQGRLHIGGGLRFSKLNEIMNPMICGFEEKYPDIDIFIEDIQYHDYRELLLQNSYDVVFSLHFPNMNNEGLEFYDLFAQPFCVWVSASNCLADRSSIRLEELSGMKLRVLEEERCGQYVSYLRDLFAQRGLRIKMGRSLNQAISFGNEDFGLTPNFDPSEHFGYGIRSVKVEDAGSAMFSIVRKRHISNPIAALFFEEFKEFYQVHFEDVAAVESPMP